VHSFQDLLQKWHDMQKNLKLIKIHYWFIRAWRS